MSDHAVVHFELGGPDGKALQNFYANLFGWTVNADNPANYGLVLKTADGIGGGIVTPHFGSRKSFATVYVTCGDDVALVLDKALSLGATKELDTFQPPVGPMIAGFNDPDENLVGLVAGTSTESPPMTGGGDPVTWFEIIGKDNTKTQEFYRDLFDWQINSDNPIGYGEVGAIGNGIGGGIFGDAGGDPRVTIYAEVDNLEEKLAKSSALGGTTVLEPTSVPGGPTIAMFRDLAGNTTGMILRGSRG
jgi:predicted enzyme related to lactoylglutathione lyase